MKEQRTSWHGGQTGFAAITSLGPYFTPDVVAAAAAAKRVYAAPHEHLQTLLEELLQKQAEVLGSRPIIWLNSGAEAVSSFCSFLQTGPMGQTCKCSLEMRAEAPSGIQGSSCAYSNKGKHCTRAGGRKNNTAGVRN